MSDDAAQTAPASGLTWDQHDDERRNIQTLLRWVGGFFAWPGLTIALVFLLDLEGHMGHFLISLTAGVGGVLVFLLAPKLAARAYPPA